VEAPKAALPETPAPRPAPEPPRPRAPVRVGGFDDATPAARPSVGPERRVDVGGFGAPADGPRDANRPSANRLPSVGAFDLPAGAGGGRGPEGSGAGGKGRGTTANAGFWDAGGAGGGARNGGGNGTGRGESGVQSSGFGDYTAAPRAAGRPAPAAPSPTTP